MEPELELTPDQPVEVERTLAELLDPEPSGPDPWWQAGNAESLET